MTYHLSFMADIFFSMCLALMVASLLETILITNLLLSSKTVIPVPRWIRVFVLHFLGRVVGLPWEEVKDAGIQKSVLINTLILKYHRKLFRFYMIQQVFRTAVTKVIFQI